MGWAEESSDAFNSIIDRIKRVDRMFDRIKELEDDASQRDSYCSLLGKIDTEQKKLLKRITSEKQSTDEIISQCSGTSSERVNQAVAWARQIHGKLVRHESRYFEFTYVTVNAAERKRRYCR